jgi:serine/threonine protein kinase
MGTNVNQILAKHLEEDAPTLRKIRPDLNMPERLDQAVSRSLARKPAQRFQSISELKAELESIIRELS